MVADALIGGFVAVPQMPLKQAGFRHKSVAGRMPVTVRTRCYVAPWGLRKSGERPFSHLREVRRRAAVFGTLRA
jgi:hypothetical protein